MQVSVYSIRDPHPTDPVIDSLNRISATDAVKTLTGLLKRSKRKKTDYRGLGGGVLVHMYMNSFFWGLYSVGGGGWVSNTHVYELLFLGTVQCWGCCSSTHVYIHFFWGGGQIWSLYNDILMRRK